MGKYIRKRLIQSIPVVFGITILTYFIMKLAPGGPLANMFNPRTSAESILRAKEAMGLNKPIIIQYVNWLRELLQGNFGYSTNSGQQVLAMILERLPATLLLTVTAFVISFVVEFRWAYTLRPTNTRQEITALPSSPLSVFRFPASSSAWA